jgi:hypothetical protein
MNGKIIKKSELELWGKDEYNINADALWQRECDEILEYINKRMRYQMDRYRDKHDFVIDFATFTLASPHKEYVKTAMEEAGWTVNFVSQLGDGKLLNKLILS